MRVTHDSRTALSRARFFLDKAIDARADERVEFEAYLEAAIVFARAALHRFKFKHEKHRKWNAWWDSLRENPNVNFFRKERDRILKEATPRIGQSIFVPSIVPEGSDIVAPVARKAAELYFFEDQETPATATVEKHLKAIEQLLLDAEREFK